MGGALVFNINVESPAQICKWLKQHQNLAVQITDIFTEDFFFQGNQLRFFRDIKISYPNIRINHYWGIACLLCYNRPRAKYNMWARTRMRIPRAEPTPRVLVNPEVIEIED